MPDKSKDLILRQYEEKINQQLLEVIQADPMNASIAMMRAELAKLMAIYVAKVTENLEESFKKLEKNIDRMLE
jgi:uncharacterized small protein (DUF1192 family)